MGLATLVLLASCSFERLDVPAASPAIWEISGANGQLEGWLFGTIHQLPDGYNWRTEKLENALERADWLAVEIADLEDTGSLRTIFDELARSPAHPPLSARVEQQYRDDLSALLAKGNYSDNDFTEMETWAAALTLAQLFSSGESENGVDRALIRQFAAVFELEGTRKQLSTFDNLPEEDQRDLLEGIVRESVKVQAAEPRALANAWMTGDLDGLIDENSDTILSDPELREALLINRNQDWARKLDVDLSTKGPIMVAVGAAHMLGEEGLPTLLRQRGYTVRRIQ